MIAALRKARNCLCLEKNGLLFINSKSNVIENIQGNKEKENKVTGNESNDIQ